MANELAAIPLTRLNGTSDALANHAGKGRAGGECRLQMRPDAPV